MNSNKAWEEFFKSGWEYRELPTKRDCFDAGFKAGLEAVKEKEVKKEDKEEK